jgi:class 3 adenylate cyclase
MDIEDFLDELKEEAEIMFSDDFNIEVTNTVIVPNISDSSLTYDNLDNKTKKVKVIETCVLYIDVRKSTSLNLNNSPETLSKLYSFFVKNMIKAAKCYGGHIRSIVGDRIMVVFDSENCCQNAIKTAYLLNTIAVRILDLYFRRYAGYYIKCGIGIDYGKMMVSKVGTIKKGIEKESHRSLVWLGKPANIASKLTDHANKMLSNQEEYIECSFCLDEAPYTYSKKYTLKEFVNSLEKKVLPNFEFNDKELYYMGEISESKNYPIAQVLITEEMYEKSKESENIDGSAFNQRNWSIQEIRLDEYSGKIYGSNVWYLPDR